MTEEIIKDLCRRVLPSKPYIPEIDMCGVGGKKIFIPDWVMEDDRSYESIIMGLYGTLHR